MSAGIVGLGMTLLRPLTTSSYAPKPQKPDPVGAWPVGSATEAGSALVRQRAHESI